MLSFVRVLGLVLPILASAACYSWMPSEEARTRALRPATIRVDLFDGRRAILHRPWFRSDSLGGTNRDTSIAFAVSAVRGIQERKLDRGRTVFAVLGTVSVAVTALLVALFFVGPAT